jgi:hypothetical protein
MTTSMGLIVIVTLLVASGVILLRGSRQKRLSIRKRIIFSTLAGVVVLFFAWLAVMVFVVGPSMRAM